MLRPVITGVILNIHQLFIMDLKNILILLLILFTGLLPGFAQEVITVEDLIALALKESPMRKAAALQVTRQETLVRKATMLPDLEGMFESPTGDFYVAGVEQTFEFPTVYSHQKKLAQAQVLAAQNDAAISDRQIRFHIRSHYLDWQYAVAFQEYTRIRDSVYQQIMMLSDRQFRAGEKDGVEKILSEIKYAEAHAAWIQAGYDVRIARAKLEPYTEGLDTRIPVPLELGDLSIADQGMISDSLLLTENWMLDAYRISEGIANREMKLEKARRLPDFRLGYLNQGVRNNPFEMGLRLGVSVPLPTGAYKASIEAAEIELSRIEQQKLQASQDLRAEWHQIVQQVKQYHEILEFLKTKGITLSTDLIRSAQRMFEAGQYDLVRLLTLVADSFTQREMYLDNLVAFHRAILQLHYLNGTI